VLALLAGGAAAQDVRLYRADEAVDPHDVARILDTSPPPAPVMKMRSLRLLDDAAANTLGGSAAPQQLAAATPQPAADSYAADAGKPVAAPSHPVERVKAKALALPIQFAFDSANILPAARRQLEALAEGIRMLPAIQSVVIEGHTDARGSEAYNDQLSTRRAYAVKRYLVTVQGIDPGRLRAVGMGKYAPLSGRDPYAPENRRVQFRGE
jgi:outer membrane protein OmpA-like peptidoglycan-associated protein